MLLFLAMALFEPWLHQNITASRNLKNIKKKDFEIIAHKGASGLAPENTLASFQLALTMGVDIIELDVRNTKDEEIVVIHDETLDRTTSGTGNVHDYTLEEIRQLDAGSWFDSKFKEERVPTLREVLDLVGGKCRVLIEIKHMDHPHYDDFAQKLVDVIRQEENGFDWVILQSYEEKYLEEAHAYDEHVQTKQMLVGEDSAPLIAFYVESRMHLGRSEKSGQLMALNPHYKTLSPRRVFRMHAKGYKVYAYPVNERKDMIVMLNMGVDGIITDFPDRLIQLKKELEMME